MLEQLRWSTRSSLVLVGHSHYFRELCKKFRAEGCTLHDASGAALPPTDLDSKKLSNAGVAKCTLTFDDAKAVGTPLTSVELLFETKLVD